MSQSRLNLNVPGVYVEDASFGLNLIQAVKTTVPAFIGYSEQAVDTDGNILTHVPTRITSFGEYVRYYGGPAPVNGFEIEIKNYPVATVFRIESSMRQGTYFMYHSVRSFFDNGGRECLIASVGEFDDAGLVERSDLFQGLTACGAIDEITLYVIPDAQGFSTSSVCYSFYAEVLEQCARLRDRFLIMDIWQDPDTPRANWQSHIQTMRDELSVDLELLKYGASYFSNLVTGSELELGNMEQIQVTQVGGDGRLTGPLKELQVEDKDLFKEIVKEFKGYQTVMPPSGAIAGIYVRTDEERGVWTAPANAVVRDAIAPEITISDEEQDGLNVDATTGKSVNAIRFFEGRGVRIWGARTLAGNDDEGRYVSVRRFLIMVEESIKKALENFVFDPNTSATWDAVRAMIEYFLNEIWRAGGLQGSMVEDAYFVRVGLGETMTQRDILEGRMVIEIGVTVIRPAEFIILRIAQQMAVS